MPPKKKKSGGDAAKGERIFKNLCSACHSLSVIYARLDSLVPLDRSRAWWRRWKQHRCRRRLQLFVSACLKSDAQMDRWKPRQVAQIPS